MFKFIHAADIHLDSQLQGLSQYEGAPLELIRGATRRAFRNLVDLAIHERVAFVLIAGDVYDGDWKDYSTGQFFCQQVGRLHDAGIQTLVVLGNHDAASVLTRSLRLPDSARQFSSAKAETIILDDLGVAVHGRSFAKKAVTDNLAIGYPPPISGLFNIGMLHTAANTGTAHENYAPCTAQELASRGYRYWALGHVHAGTELLSTPEQWIGFSGNLQGRHIRETGPKGCRLVTVEAQDGRFETQSCELGVLRWESIVVDASPAAGVDEVLQLTEDALRTARQEAGKPLCARLEVTGATAAHGRLAWEPTRYRHDIENLASGVSEDIWLEQVSFSTRPHGQPPAGAEEIAAIIREMAVSDALKADLAAALAPMVAKLPAELREGPGDLGLSDPNRLAECLGVAAAGLEAMLTEGAADAH